MMTIITHTFIGRQDNLIEKEFISSLVEIQSQLCNALQVNPIFTIDKKNSYSQKKNQIHRVPSILLCSCHWHYVRIKSIWILAILWYIYEKLIRIILLKRIIFKARSERYGWQNVERKNSQNFLLKATEKNFHSTLWFSFKLQWNKIK